MTTETKLQDRAFKLAQMQCPEPGCIKGKQLRVNPEPRKTHEFDCWGCGGSGAMFPSFRVECPHGSHGYKRMVDLYLEKTVNVFNCPQCGGDGLDLEFKIAGPIVRMQMET